MSLPTMHLTIRKNKRTLGPSTPGFAMKHPNANGSPNYHVTSATAFGKRTPPSPVPSLPLSFRRQRMEVLKERVDQAAKANHGAYNTLTNVRAAFGASMAKRILQDAHQDADIGQIVLQYQKLQVIKQQEDAAKALLHLRGTSPELA